MVEQEQAGEKDRSVWKDGGEDGREGRMQRTDLHSAAGGQLEEALLPNCVVCFNRCVVCFTEADLFTGAPH